MSNKHFERGPGKYKPPDPSDLNSSVKDGICPNPRAKNARSDLGKGAMAPESPGSKQGSEDVHMAELSTRSKEAAEGSTAQFAQ